MAARTRTQRDDQPGDRSLHEEFFLCVRERYRGAGGCGARQHRRVRCARRPREEELTKHLGLDAHDLESALDPDEISRVEFAPDTISLIWKRPKNVTAEEQLRFDVASMGLFLHQNKLIVVTDDASLSLEGRAFQGIHSPVDALLRLLRHTVHHYLGHLKAIKQITVELGDKLSSSMENRYFLQMFALGESLIYYINAIHANGAALAKLHANADRIGFSAPQLESLADLMLDNQQCSR
jgi:magnesium transporter